MSAAESWASKRDKQRRVMNIFSTTALHSLAALHLFFANYSIGVLNEQQVGGREERGREVGEQARQAAKSENIVTLQAAKSENSVSIQVALFHCCLPLLLPSPADISKSNHFQFCGILGGKSKRKKKDWTEF